MKNFNKITALLLSVGMIGSLAACGGGAAQTSTPPASGAPATSGEPSGVTEDSAGNILAADGSFEIAMITDKGDINDKSFNQGTWEGIKNYCSENGKTCKYYKPAAATTDDYVTSMEQAIKDGAKVVVTPGFLFEEPVYLVQDQYPDVSSSSSTATPTTLTPATTRPLTTPSASSSPRSRWAIWPATLR